jgi:hypothetical protein
LAHDPAVYRRIYSGGAQLKGMADGNGRGGTAHDPWGIELAADAVAAGVGAAARAQAAIVRQVYAPFAWLGPLAAPAHAIEHIQTAITDQIYATILGTSRFIARSAVTLLEQPQDSR